MAVQMIHPIGLERVPGPLTDGYKATFRTSCPHGYIEHLIPITGLRATTGQVRKVLGGIMETKHRKQFQCDCGSR